MARASILRGCSYSLCPKFRFCLFSLYIFSAIYQEICSLFRIKVPSLFVLFQVYPAKALFLYIYCYIYQSTVCRLPVTLDAPKSHPMVSPDRTAHNLCRPIRGLQDVTSLWRARNHVFWFTMGLAPSTLQSHITQSILTQLPAYWA